MRSFYISLAVVVVLVVGLVLGFVLVKTTSPDRHVPVPVPTGTFSGRFCYVELQIPSYPVLWLQTARTGGGDASCQAIVSAAKTDTPAGTSVFESAKPSPVIIVAQRGGLTILAAPGTVSAKMKKGMGESLARMLPGQ